MTTPSTSFPNLSLPLTPQTNPHFPTADAPQGGTPAEERILGDKAVGGVNNDDDHVPNVVSGLKGYVAFPTPPTTHENFGRTRLRTTNRH